MQRNLIGKYLKGSRGGELKDAALVAFVSPNGEDWRFSLVKMDYKLGETPTGKPKGIEEFTPARRFSFIVGPNEHSHTAQSCLVPILEDDEHNPTLKQLEAAFSVEKVTKEFFTKYSELYHNVKDALDEIVEKDAKIRADFSEKKVSTVDFAKKLLGQIVFLYFLQKKGWFGVARDDDWGTGPKDFLRRLFEKNIAPYDNFFNDILEPLFYEALAVERSRDFYSRFNCKIPFLNGGLFDPIGDYDWVHTDILLPDDLFSNHHKTKEGDIGTGILDVFDRYNFTVKEDEPLEKEVAVDPEMLGKVFENLLEVKDRKSKGTYYTPREIVHYMCQESLINYLCTACNERAKSYQKLGAPQTQAFGNEVLAKGTEQDIILEESNAPVIPREDIETLIKYGETAVEHDSLVENQGRETKTYSYKLPETIRANAKLIDEKLATIYVCDPAVGSGAFLVGMMNEIIRLRNTLTSYLKSENGRTLYYFKRHAIQNCLYGVDIDPSAVEIAKLRLWLSLIVDEEDIKHIKPLPNLDYKVVCGNSLLGVEKNLFNQQLFNQLEELKPKFFEETNARKKHALKRQIDELIGKITNGRRDFDFEVYFSEVFHVKTGFDVVIGNPPYVRIQGMSQHFVQALKRFFRSAKGKFDIYVCFIEKGFSILTKRGFLCFINPNKFFSASYGNGLRSFIRENRALLQVIDFGDSQVFSSAINYTCILQLSKTPVEKVKYKRIYSSSDIDEFSFVRNDFKEINQPSSSDPWVFDTNLTNSILSRFSNMQTLRDVCDEIFQGLISGGDKIFYLEFISHAGSTVTARSLINGAKYKLDANICFRLLKGAEIKRYLPSKANLIAIYPYYETSNRKTLLIPERDLALRYPKTYSYLLEFKNLLQNRGSERMEYESWYAYWCPRLIRKFKTPKILTQVLASKANYTIDESGKTLFVGGGNAGGYGIIPKRGIRIKYILALLNSSLLDHILRTTSTQFQGGFFSYARRFIEKLPIKLDNEEIQLKMEILVDEILAITSTDDYLNNPAKQAQVKEYERQIDQLVYGLYGLPDEEIAVVEGTSNG